MKTHSVSPTLKKPARKRIAACALAFILASPLGAQTSHDLPSLLKSLAENKARMSKLMKNASMTMTTRTEQLDRNGKVESTTEAVERVTYENGQEKKELMRFFRDGRDVTEEERKRRTERPKKKDRPDEKDQSLSLSEGFPFSDAEQAKHRFSILGPDAGDTKRLRIRFEPKEKRLSEVATGEAVVDAAAVPVEVRYRPSKYPRLVSQMDVRMEYRAATPAGSLLSRVSVDVTVSLLVLKKRIRTTTTFSDYAFGGNTESKPAPAAE